MSYLKKLQELPSLNKIHYSWPNSIVTDDNYLYEYCRITHTLNIDGKYGTVNTLERFVNICNNVNNNPSVVFRDTSIVENDLISSLSLVFQPWASVTVTDETDIEDEIDFIEGKLVYWKEQLASANALYSADVKITAVLLDSENVKMRSDLTWLCSREEWNYKLAAYFDRVDTIIEDIFPGVRKEWYGRGISRVGGGTVGFAKNSYFTGLEENPVLSVMYYFLWERRSMQEIHHRTCDLMDELNEGNPSVDNPSNVKDEITIWVALGSGSRRNMAGGFYFDTDYDYDLIYSYHTGAHISGGWWAERPERFADYNKTQVLVFYPECGNLETPHWDKHFIAYVRGNNSIADLTDLGWYQGY